MPRRCTFVLACLSLAACRPASITHSSERPKTTGCSTDSDCVFWCEPKGDCCHNPYCEEPALASDARAIEAYNREHCTEKENAQCPSIGSIDPDHRSPELRCVENTCVAQAAPAAAASSAAVNEPAPGAGGADRSCKTKDDCRVVKIDPCDKCGCATTPVNAKEAARLATVASEIECASKHDDRVCGECRGAIADCQAGSCVAKPEP